MSSGASGSRFRGSGFNHSNKLRERESQQRSDGRQQFMNLQPTKGSHVNMKHSKRFVAARPQIIYRLTTNSF